MHHGKNAPGDQVPVLADRDRDRRLDVRHVHHAVVGAGREGEVVLEGQADRVGDRILRLLGQVVLGRYQFGGRNVLEIGSGSLGLLLQGRDAGGEVEVEA